ncbi:BREX-3 system phosphatase PglZ [Priestia megaterium]|uniref:BREX-3 system phosphatase PglZ n=1 Tax=Priestia megaterium TaxID=1404 RepID=UPI0039FCE008
MKNWRDEIYKNFYNQPFSFFVVNDPDYLLNDEVILEHFSRNGFQTILFDDSISFRYIYEMQYRTQLENKETKLIVYSNKEQQDIFPFDYLSKGHHVELKINHLFPKFSAAVIRQLDKEDLNVLYLAHSHYQGSLSNKETVEYILKSVFKIAHELIDNKVELYKFLLSVHYGKKELPVIIQEYLIEQLSSKPAFTGIPVEKLIRSQSAFYLYIEKEWFLFIEELKKLNSNMILEEEVYQNNPFTNPDVRRLMNDLFSEGYLRKAETNKHISLPRWMTYGVQVGEEKNQKETILRLQKKINDLLETASRYKDWTIVVDMLGEYKSIILQSSDGSSLDEVNQLIRLINEKFEKWMLEHYQSLTSLPPLPKPKMVHHIAPNLASKRDNNEKIALIVIDGMSFIQWKVVKQYLSTKGFSFEENGVFAWVPTLTSVSRQAIFGGQMPAMFASNIRTTNKEENSWKTFWEDYGVLKQYVQYQKRLGKETYSKSEIKAFKRPNIKVFGAVVDSIDQFTHGAIQGEKSIMAELNIWLQSGYLTNLLTDLCEEKFTVYITSDHGNTESVGVGRISEGVLVDQKGERVRIYTNEVIYRNSAQSIDSIIWHGIGLPKDYHVLVANYGQAFVNKNERIVSHGGISIEEVIVPFVKVIPSFEEEKNG